MLTRRQFLRLCMASALTVSLADTLWPFIREGFAARKVSKPPVIWLELGSCTGNSISLDNAVNPSMPQMLRDMLDIRYDWLLNAAHGDLAVKTLYDTVEKEAGNYWLIVEGSVMTAANGRYNYVYKKDGQLVTGMAALQELAQWARYVVAVGACACWGGPSAAYPNPGGAKGVWQVIDKPVINIPGCPAHPDWMSGTFSHLLLYGLPELDAYRRPKMFFSRTIHELCERRQQFEDGIFAKQPGQEGCLYKVGCKGPVTHADCPLRQWNHYVNWPVKAGAPCIGCANPYFPDGSMPFYNHLPDIKTRLVKADVKKVGAAAVLLGVGAVGTHLAAGIFGRRIHKHYTDGTKPGQTAPPENLEQMKQELDDLITQQSTLLAEAKGLEREKRQPRKKSLLKRLSEFWRTEDKSGKE